MSGYNIDTKESDGRIGTFNTLDICNNIRMNTEGVTSLGLPLDVFPQKVQKLILDLASYENFNVEYCIAAILSATATAIGNTYHIKVKGLWTCCPALYIMLIGRPGLGKTHPLSFAYRPIREHDERMFEKFKNDMEVYERVMDNPSCKNPETDSSSDSMNKPVLVKTIVSDFTTEAMMHVHKNNLRGICLMVDELLALFKSINRYSSNNPLVEYLLSAYSGQALDSVRKTEKMPVHIQHPCINLIGSIQTSLLSSVCNKEYTANGLLDRFIFVYPKNQRISEWKIGKEETACRNMVVVWKEIIDRILDIPFDAKTGSGEGKDCASLSHLLNFSDDARKYFFGWNNTIIKEVNAIEDDNLVESRKMKLNGNVARLALILQVLKWATGEGHKQYVDLDSVKGAVRLIDYFEDCYYRSQQALVMNEIDNNKYAWLSTLPDEFTTAEALKAGDEFNISERTIKGVLAKLSKGNSGKLIWLKHGKYRKVQKEMHDALCTSALSSTPRAQQQDNLQRTLQENTREKVQSAIVPLGPQECLHNEVEQESASDVEPLTIRSNE